MKYPTTMICDNCDTIYEVDFNCMLLYTCSACSSNKELRLIKAPEFKRLDSDDKCSQCHSTNLLAALEVSISALEETLETYNNLFTITMSGSDAEILIEQGVECVSDALNTTHAIIADLPEPNSEASSDNKKK